MKWFRLYSTILDDPKLERLTVGQFRGWIKLLALANVGTPRGTLPNAQAISYRLRIRPAAAAELVADLCTAGLLDANDDGTHSPHDWRHWQAASDDSAGRVARHRATDATHATAANGAVSVESASEVRQKLRETDKLSTEPPDRNRVNVTAMKRSVDSDRDSEDPTPIRGNSGPKPRLRPRESSRPNKSAALIDLCRDADVPIEMAGQDHAALKRSQLTAAQVAEAYCAAFRGQWGDDWLRSNLSVHLVISRWAGYQANTVAPPRPPPRQKGRFSAAEYIAGLLDAERGSSNGQKDVLVGVRGAYPGLPTAGHERGRDGGAARRLVEGPGG